MAETGRLRAMEAFWSRDESDIDSSLVHVPGVSEPGNRRPCRPVRVKGRRTQEVTAAVPVSRRPVSEAVQVTAPSKTSKLHTHSKPAKQTKRDHHEDKKAVSLKDLCKEDKQRVANLINELARVGEEKNKVALALNNEKLQFEQQMKDLVQQQERILQERQGTHVAAVQQQLWECQGLLSRYQKMVSQQQDVLTQHVSEHDQQSPRDGSYTNGHPDELPESTDRRQQGQQQSDVQPASRGQKTSVRPADVPRLPVSTHLEAADKDSQRSSTPVLDLSDGSERDTTPRGSRRVRLPSSSTAGSDRPFTAYIDGLIATEQEVSKHHVSLGAEGNNRRAGNRSGGGNNSRGTSSSSTRPYGKPPSSSSTGPLHEPVLSSTHQSDLLSVSHQSRTKAGDFQPLLPDPSPRSSLQSTVTTTITQHPLDDFSSYHHQENQHYPDAPYPPHLHHGAGGPPGPDPNNPYIQEHEALPPGYRVTFNEQRLELGSPPGGGHPSHQLSDDDFVNYYKSMTPYERQRHLQTQKAALLSEQERLRHILEDQERLLHTKQQQLHLQQDVQRRRLQHFEQTGAFPQHEAHRAPGAFPQHEAHRAPPPQVPDHQAQELLLQGLLQQQERQQYQQQQNDFSLHSATEPTYEVMPDQPAGHGLLSNLPCPRLDDLQHLHQQPLQPQYAGYNNLTGRGPQPPRLQDVEGGFPDLDPVNNGAEISREELDAVTESFENILFLQRHGIDVTDMKGNNRNVERSAGSLPVRSPPGGVSAGRPPSSRPRVETMDDLINTSRGSSCDVIEQDGQKMLRKTSKVRSSPQQINQGEHAARLLDLVDEVESSHLARHHHHHPSPGHHHPPPGSARYSMEEAVGDDAETEEDANESRILEEVFFVM